MCRFPVTNVNCFGTTFKKYYTGLSLKFRNINIKMSENGDTTQITPPHVADSEAEDLDGEEEEEVILRTLAEAPVTRTDRELINDWEEKFNKITEGLRAVEMNTHEVDTHMDIVMRENRARETVQLSANRQMESIKEALARFMETYDPARRAPVSTFVKSCAPIMETSDPARSTVQTARPPVQTQTPMRTFVQPRAPTMSTPISPPGAPEFSFSSPANQATMGEPTRGDRGRDINEQPMREKWEWDWK